MEMDTYEDTVLISKELGFISQKYQIKRGQMKKT